MAVGLLIAAFAAMAFALAATNAHGLSNDLTGHGVLDAGTFIAVGAALTVALFPYPIVAAACGFRFGTLLGTLIALVSLVIAAVASCLLARWSAGDSGAETLGSRMSRLARWLESNGFRSIAVGRTLGVPFALVNYAAGLTRIPVGRVALATCIGIAPRVFLYTALGGSLRHLDRPEARVFLGLSAAVILGLVLFPMVRKRRAQSYA